MLVLLPLYGDVDNFHITSGYCGWALQLIISIILITYVQKSTHVKFLCFA